MKNRIMEVLLSSDNGLTKDEIRWAIKHIPNEVSEKEFNHDVCNLTEACGLTAEDIPRLTKEFNGLKKALEDEHGGRRPSMVVEAVLSRGSHDLIKLMVMWAVVDQEQQTERKMKAALLALDELLGKLLKSKD